MLVKNIDLLYEYDQQRLYLVKSINEGNGCIEENALLRWVGVYTAVRNTHT